MRTHNSHIVVGLMIAFCLLFNPRAHAQVINQQTTITFSTPVQIPGKILPAGTYIFQLANSPDNRNIVQIFNADHSVLYAGLETVPTVRMKPAPDAVVTLAEPGSGQPPALVKWFYPGHEDGHEFVYRKQQEQEIAHAPRETFVGGAQVTSNPTVAGD
jgi:Protein of unknown function (DUF2911)